MDLFDVFEIGARAPRRMVRRLSGIAAGLLLFGWTQRWPIAHPIVQHVIDVRAQEALDLVLTVLE